jgi:hypothetical protein
MGRRDEDYALREILALMALDPITTANGSVEQRKQRRKPINVAVIVVIPLDYRIRWNKRYIFYTILYGPYIPKSSCYVNRRYLRLR